MSLTIFWTTEAEDTFDSIIDLLKIIGAKNLLQILLKDQKKSSIQYPPNHIVKGSYSHNIRQGFVTKQSSIFYQINDNYIVVLFFWDNRQEPIYQSLQR